MILLVHPDFFNYDLSIFQNDWLLKKLIEKCSVADKITRKSLMVLTASARLGKEINISCLLNSIVAGASRSKLRRFVSAFMQQKLHQA